MAQRRIPHNDKLGSSEGSFAQCDDISPDDSLIEEIFGGKYRIC